MLARQNTGSSYGWLISFQRKNDPSTRSRWYEWIPPTDTDYRSRVVNIGEIFTKFDGGLTSEFEIFLKPYYEGEVSWPGIGDVLDALEIDYFVFLDSSDENTQAIRLDNLGLAADASQFQVNDNELTDYGSDFIIRDGNGAGTNREHLGNTYLTVSGSYGVTFSDPRTNIKMILMGVVGNQFNMRKVGFASGVIVEYNVTRKESYLIPV